MADSGTMPSEDMPRLGPTWSRGGGMFKPPKRPEGHNEGVSGSRGWEFGCCRRLVAPPPQYRSPLALLPHIGELVRLGFMT